MTNAEGYRLKMNGDRLNELLNRHFIVPTFESPPNNTVTSWQDGDYTVQFRIGELCRVKESNEWQFYRLQDLSYGNALWIKANASELPDLSNYYTKQEVDKQIEQHQPDLSGLYTKEQTDQKIQESISSIVMPEDESIKNVTEDEYNTMFDTNVLSDNTMYFVSKDGSPIALYIGKIQIAVREEGSKGFAYNFPIIF